MSEKTREICTVVSQESIGAGIYSMWIQTDRIAADAKPGQFVSLYTNDKSKILPRPISLCEIDKENAIRENALEADVIYACGPTPMLRAIKKYAEENGIECYISLEERMACGIGACLACVCKSREKDAHSNVNNKRICKDGPVFLSTEVEI